MVISIRKLILPAAGFMIIILLTIILSVFLGHKTNHFMMGGTVCKINHETQDETMSVFNTAAVIDESERFQRPSKQPPLKLIYAAKEYFNKAVKPVEIKKKFQKPEEVIHTYYALLQEASNMIGYHGGCGTVGWSKVPYPYAYELLSNETKQKMSLDKFTDSFSGIGHTTLLKLYPAYQPAGTPDNIKYYISEIEVITGPAYTEQNKKIKQPGYFAYYYGLITTENLSSEGWKIKSIAYIPEDFLCHPMHHWDYDAESLIGIVYKNWYGMIDKIDKIEKDNYIISVYSSRGKNKYRFEFIRLTNGDDLLVHEYIQQNGQWKEVNLLKDEHQFYKFSVLNQWLTGK